MMPFAQPHEWARGTSPAERFERFRAEGTDPDPAQNAIAAFRRVAGMTGEPMMAFWDRWCAPFGGLDVLVHQSGAELVRWMGRQLLKSEWTASTLPGNDGIYPAQPSMETCQRRLSRFIDQRATFDRAMERLDLMTFDVERMEGDVERIGIARGLIQRMRLRVATIAREIANDLRSAIERDQSAQTARLREDAMRWSRPVAADLAKKPSTASFTGWYRATHEGRDVWTDGYVLDLAGEPHLTGWRERLCPARNGEGARTVDVATIIKGDAIRPACPIGIYGAKNEKYSTVVFDIGHGDVVGLPRAQVRYFMSKHQGVEFVPQGHKAPMHVRKDGVLVGLVAPLKAITDMAGRIESVADINGRLDSTTATTIREDHHAAA